jgi:predicted ArsR family transcriptional regulator
MAVQQCNSGLVEMLGERTPQTVVLRVDNPDHWQVLRSPYRMRILEALHGSAGCSIKELADALGCSSTALYYHLDLLVQAGAITSTVLEPDEFGVHRGGRRPAVFAAAGDRVVVEYDPESPEACRRIAAMRKAWMDEAHDEFMPHIGAGDAADMAAPTLEWETLTPAEAAEVREHLQRIRDVLSAARARRHASEAVVARATHLVHAGLVSVHAETLPSPMFVLRPARAKHDETAASSTL